MNTPAKIYIGGVDQDDERCLRCASFALDTGWECTECGYDNRPHYHSAEDGKQLAEERAE